MKVVVTGGRDFAAANVVWTALDTLHKQDPITLLAHGACGVTLKGLPETPWAKMRGADRLADEWAHANGVAVMRFPVAPNVDGPWPAAGQRRNGRMLAHAHGSPVSVPLVVAFDGGRGTDGCVAQALSRGLRVWRVHGIGPWWTETLDGGKGRG